MCGRIGQYLPSSYLEAFFRIDPKFVENRAPDYNAPPTRDLMVVRIDPETGKRAIAVMKWGLVPFFSKTGKMDYSTFNAKCEGVEKAASFRGPFKSRRCIVPADLYYEWKKLGPGPKDAKQPYAIARADGEPLCLAGLWELWEGQRGRVGPLVHGPHDGPAIRLQDDRAAPPYPRRAGSRRCADMARRRAGRPHAAHAALP